MRTEPGLVYAATDEFEHDAKSVLQILTENRFFIFDPKSLVEQSRLGYPDPKWDPEQVLYFWAKEVLENVRRLKASADDEQRLIIGIVLGRAAGFMYGGIENVKLWRQYQESTKGGRKIVLGKKQDSYRRMNALTRFILEHGPVPDKGDFGKANPARTKYFQKFKRDTGAKLSVDTFNRYVESITQEELDYVKSMQAEAAAARFLQVHAKTFCKASPKEQMKIYEQFKNETGFDVAIEKFEMYAEFELSHPGFSVGDFESRVAPY